MCEAPLRSAHVVAVGRDLFSRTLAPDGTVWTWGFPGPWLGNPSSTGAPVSVLGLHDIVNLGGGQSSNFAVQSDGSFWAWGGNFHGQLGDGTTNDSEAPVRVLPSLSDPLPPDQGNVLRAVKRWPDVSLDFAGAPATAWRIYRDAEKAGLGVTELTPDANTTSFVDPGAIAGTPEPLLFYRLKGLSDCFHAPGP